MEVGEFDITLLETAATFYNAMEMDMCRFLSLYIYILGVGTEIKYKELFVQVKAANCWKRTAHLHGVTHMHLLYRKSYS